MKLLMVQPQIDCFPIMQFKVNTIIKISIYYYYKTPICTVITT